MVYPPKPFLLKICAAAGFVFRSLVTRIGRVEYIHIFKVTRLTKIALYSNDLDGDDAIQARMR